MSQRHVAEANSSGANPRGDENGQLIEEVPQSNAGDALRQLGKANNAAFIVGADDGDGVGGGTCAGLIAAVARRNPRRFFVRTDAMTHPSITQ